MSVKEGTVVCIGYFLLWFSACTWWLGGLWRSAGKHVGRGGRIIWASAARVAVILICLSGALLTTFVSSIGGRGVRDAKVITQKSNVFVPQIYGTMTNWQIMKRFEPSIFDSKGEYTPAMKKRLREVLALQLKGWLQADNGVVDVNIEGADHDTLIFRNARMNETNSAFLASSLEVADSNFWNRVRLLEFSAVGFKGDSYSRSILRPEIIQRTQRFDDFVAENAAEMQRNAATAKSNVNGEELLSADQKKAARNNYAQVILGRR